LGFTQTCARGRASDEALARRELWATSTAYRAIKDKLDTAGVRTTAGAPFLAKHVRFPEPPRDCYPAVVVVHTIGGFQDFQSGSVLRIAGPIHAHTS